MTVTTRPPRLSSEPPWVWPAAAQPTYVTTLPCAGQAMVVNGVTYYQCSATWYSRGCQSGAIVYVVGAPPRIVRISGSS
jgi:hypothetical protein